MVIVEKDGRPGAAEKPRLRRVRKPFHEMWTYQARRQDFAITGLEIRSRALVLVPLCTPAQTIFFVQLHKAAQTSFFMHLAQHFLEIS